MGEVHELPKVEIGERAKLFLEWTREIAIKHRPNMAGFIVLVWDKDGSLSICGDTRSADNPIPNFLLPAWVAEHLRAEFITANEVKGVLRDVGLIEPTEPPAG